MIYFMVVLLSFLVKSYFIIQGLQTTIIADTFNLQIY